MLGLCACGSGGNTTGTDANEGNKAVIAEELQGKWYGPNSQPQLDINADGKGTVTLGKETLTQPLLLKIMFSQPFLIAITSLEITPWKAKSLL